MTEKPQQPPSYPLRMPQALREHLAESAKKNNRSMNAEIIARLEESYFDHGSPAKKYTDRAIRDEMQAVLDRFTEQLHDTLERTEFVEPDEPGGKRRLVIRKKPTDT